MKKIIMLITAALFTISLTAQNEIDALRYSQITFGGTARYMATGGAFGALGADFSVLSTNPAGIGFYKSSEFTFTPSFYTGKTLSEYNGDTREDLKYNFSFNNIGFIFTASTDDADWKNIQFGIGVNRYNNFNNRIIIEGANSENSLLTDYLNKANGTDAEELDQFSTRLAFDTWLLDTLTGSPLDYYIAVPNGGVLQRKSITTNGGMNEIVLSMGGNYDDKLYIGGTVGFPYIRYFEQSTYSEIDEADTIPFFKEFSLNEDIATTGSGVNFKLGMIYRANDYVRLGAAIHTPTFFMLHDSYSRTMKSSFDNGDNYSSDSPEGDFDYELTTPMRAIGSISFIIGKKGLISADYEFVDYSDARLRSNSYKFFDENDAIQASYKAQHNIRVGGELRLAPMSIRGGYALYGSPFKTEINDGKRSSFSFGIGFREKTYFLDLAYVYTMASENYYLYNPNLVNPAKNDFTGQNFLLTLGFKY